ncbi:MAG: 4-hydroxy-3-methylbut-2-enyl diphosphate reductase [Micavibrio sp.]|nr:4-hydroxy-3-methylbut-2-enyl diphosphate reductase [Micavibrio sp.]
MAMDQKRQVKLYLAAPRGFCAGVDRAIQIVEQALEKYGKPVYVRHEIVHNKFVVDGLRDKGAVFVEELHEIPTEHKDRPVIFSAHGVPKSVPEEASAKNMFYIDATCPLVSKVHREAERHHKNGAHIILIGHNGHPEVEGTMGQLPDGSVTLIETVDDVATLDFPADETLAFATQTTLSLDDTADIVAALQEKFPQIRAPHKEDICYATTNRQSAVKEIADKADVMFVIGAPNSSNSNRLVEVAKNYGAKEAYLIQFENEIKEEWLENAQVIGLTAGASAPDILVKNVIRKLEDKFDLDVEEVAITKEDIVFKLPRAVA